MNLRESLHFLSNLGLNKPKGLPEELVPLEQKLCVYIRVREGSRIEEEKEKIRFVPLLVSNFSHKPFYGDINVERSSTKHQFLLRTRGRQETEK